MILQVASSSAGLAGLLHSGGHRLTLTSGQEPSPGFRAFVKEGTL